MIDKIDMRLSGYICYDIMCAECIRSSCMLLIGLVQTVHTLEIKGLVFVVPQLLSRLGGLSCQKLFLWNFNMFYLRIALQRSVSACKHCKPADWIQRSGHLRYDVVALTTRQKQVANLKATKTKYDLIIGMINIR